MCVTSCFGLIDGDNATFSNILFKSYHHESDDDLFVFVVDRQVTIFIVLVSHSCRPTALSSVLLKQAQCLRLSENSTLSSWWYYALDVYSDL